MPEVLGRAGALLAAFRREVDRPPGGARADPPRPRRDRRRRRTSCSTRSRWCRTRPTPPTGACTCRRPSRCRPRRARSQPLLAAIAALGLHAIPRGAGTGLTGGAVPLRGRLRGRQHRARSNRIRGIEERAFTLADGRTVRASVMTLEAGVVTERAMEEAADRGLVFATDPTSAWACTIGGNIAENAGGQDRGALRHLHRQPACLDVAMPGGTILGAAARAPAAQDPPRRHGALARRGRRPARDVRTIALTRRGDPQARPLEGHHEQGAGRGAGPAEGGHRRRHHLRGVRSPPALRGRRDALPGVLRRRHGRGERGHPRARRAPSPTRAAEALQALEHFDDQYVRAIDYRVKAARAETPKAVLLIDVVGHDAAQLRRGVATIARSARAPRRTPSLSRPRDAAGGEALLGRPQEASARSRRARTPSSSTRTSCCRSRRSPEFARFVDGVNLEEEREQPSTSWRARLRDFFEEAPRRRTPQWLGGKSSPAPSTLCERGARGARRGRTPRSCAAAPSPRGCSARCASWRAATPEVAAGDRGRSSGTCARASSCSRRTCTPATATCT